MIQGLTELVDFYERLGNAEDIFHTQGVENYKNKKTKQSGEHRQSSKLAHIKGLYQAANPSEEEANKNKTKKLTCVPSTCPWSRHELTKGHACTSQSHEVDLVD